MSVKEVYNSQLMGIADYECIKKLTYLYRNLYHLEGLSMYGDSVATCIYIDLTMALEAENLTELQRNSIKNHLIERYTLHETAIKFNKSTSTINHAVRGGIRNIQKALRGGTLYADK